MQEEWRDIACIGNNYQVSNLGNIRRISSGSSVSIKSSKDRCGYLRIKIGDKSYAVHRLVAMAFIPNPYNHPIVHHIDENKSNNNASNLLWCTHQQNRIFGIPATSGTNAKRKYKVLQFDMDGNMVAEWNTFAAAAKSLGLKDGSVISKCARHQEHRDSAYGYRWAIIYDDTIEKRRHSVLFERAYRLDPEETIRALKTIIKKNRKIVE